MVQDYPEHRLHFFALLRAITNNCFSTLFAMSPEQLRLVINSIIWAFRHTVRCSHSLRLQACYAFCPGPCCRPERRVIPAGPLRLPAANSMY